MLFQGRHSKTASDKLMNDTPDIALWEALKQGDKESLGQLFRKYYEPLFRYGSKLTTHEVLLEDCIQELFTELWLSKSNPEIRSVKAYLFKSLKYKLFRVLQKPANRPASESTELLFELSHADFLVSQEEQNEKSVRVMDALDKLSSRQKEIIYLKYYQELSYEEVTEIMNINYQVARNLLYQSIKSLREMLASFSPLFLLMMH